jgi:hypothetical protein
MFHAGLPQRFWAEAVNTATYLHNRSPISSLPDKTPYECWYGTKPNVSNLKVFGSICFVLIPDSLRRKLDPKSQKGIFVGYPLQTKGYKVYDIESKRFVRTKDVLFHEDKFHDFQLPVSYHQFKDVDDHIDHEDEDEMHNDVRVEPTIPVEIENQEHTPAVGVTQRGTTYEENFL